MQPRGSSGTGRDYRAAVGPPEKYDLIGALQFKVLTDHGLREHHNLCDIGCGSLRGGRLFIAYLEPGRYYGIEPQKWLVEAGIEAHFGPSILEVKRPTFLYRDDLALTAFGVEFDYILAQSIFSHAAQDQIKACLSEASRCLAPDGLFIATFFEGVEPYQGKTWRRSPVVQYPFSWFVKEAESVGFNVERLDYPHPSGQTWVAFWRKQ